MAAHLGQGLQGDLADVGHLVGQGGPDDVHVIAHAHLAQGVHGHEPVHGLLAREKFTEAGVEPRASDGHAGVERRLLDRVGGMAEQAENRLAGIRKPQLATEEGHGFEQQRLVVAVEQRHEKVPGLFPGDARQGLGRQGARPVRQLGKGVHDEPGAVRAGQAREHVQGRQPLGVAALAQRPAQGLGQPDLAQRGNGVFVALRMPLPVEMGGMGEHRRGRGLAAHGSEPGHGRVLHVLLVVAERREQVVAETLALGRRQQAQRLAAEDAHHGLDDLVAQHLGRGVHALEQHGHGLDVADLAQGVHDHGGHEVGALVQGLDQRPHRGGVADLGQGLDDRELDPLVVAERLAQARGGVGEGQFAEAHGRLVADVDLVVLEQRLAQGRDGQPGVRGAQDVRRENADVRVGVVQQFDQRGEVLHAHGTQDVHGGVAGRRVVGAQKRLDRAHDLLAADLAQGPVGRLLHAHVARAQKPGQQAHGLHAAVFAGLVRGVAEHVRVVAAQFPAKFVAVHHAASSPGPRAGHL
ncbi:hypothetical protein DSECCO2_537660 [anaerobic digester metagenome]